MPDLRFSFPECPFLLFKLFFVLRKGAALPSGRGVIYILERRSGRGYRGGGIHKNMDKTKVKVDFRISGADFEADSITKALCLRPTGVKKNGERIGNTNKRYDHTTWIYSTGEVETLYAENVFEEILKLLLPKQKELIELKEKMNVDYRVDVIIIIEDNQPPSMSFEKEYIDFLSTIGGNIDVDIYIN